MRKMEPARIEAMLKNLKRYWSAVPCKFGHTSECYSSNGLCCMCSTIKCKTWRDRNITDRNMPASELENKCRIARMAKTNGVRVFIDGKEVLKK